LFQEGVRLGLLEKKREERKKEERKNKERDKKEKKIIKRKKRERKKRERKKERVRERESHGSTHSSSSCTQTIKKLLLFLAKPLLLHLDRHLLTCTKGDVACAPNHKALCQQIVPPMNMVPTHEARVPHTTAAATPRYPS